MNNKGTKIEHVIVLVHGIRTRANWQDMVKEVLEDVPGVQVLPTKFGRFDLFSFLLPGPTRNPPINKTRRSLAAGTNLARRNNAKMSVICHSYGTYAVTKILNDDSNIEIDNLIMCGSIVHQKFDWYRVIRQIHGVVINDFGVNDVWPVFAKSVTWGYGDSGTYGIGSPVVEDRRHIKNHSSFFDYQFVEDYWKPLFESDEVIRTRIGDGDIPESPRWFDIFSIPLRFVIALALIVCGFTLYNEFNLRDFRNVVGFSDEPIIDGNSTVTTSGNLYISYVAAQKNRTLSTDEASYILPKIGELTSGSILKILKPTIFFSAPKVDASKKQIVAAGCVKIISNGNSQKTNGTAVSSNFLPVELVDCLAQKTISPDITNTPLDIPTGSQTTGVERISKDISGRQVSVPVNQEAQEKFEDRETKQPKPKEVICAPGPYLIFFDYESNGISPEAATVLDNSIRAYKNCGRSRVEINGHTDTSEEKSIEISTKRAVAVGNYYLSRGIINSAVSAFGVGSSSLRVPTADGVREPQNRRVTIQFKPAN